MRRRWQPQAIDGVADGVVLFDGVCVFCSRWVRFVIARDRAAFFRFAPLQDGVGAALGARLGIAVDNPETNAVIVGGVAYFKSDAAIAVLTRLPGWGWAGALRIVPRSLRDRVYDWAARNRYRWFGRTANCLVPSPELAPRFLSRQPPADR